MSKKKNAAPKAGKLSANTTDTTTTTVAKDAKAENGRDWGKTLFLPKTAFSMKAGLPNLEPKLLERWEKMKLYQRMRKEAKGREKFTLHDGPPYANGNIHIGHALNKLLKDIVVRSQTMLGKDLTTFRGGIVTVCPSNGKSRSNIAPRAKTRTKCR